VPDVPSSERLAAAAFSWRSGGNKHAWASPRITPEHARRFRWHDVVVL
jgi:hypothetical protein